MKQSSVREDDKGVWIGGPTAGYRVHDVQVYNKETGVYEPLDLSAQYNMAGYNYTLRDLGGGFNMFEGAVNVLDYVMEDYMVLSNYVQAFENAQVAASNSPLAAKYEGFTVDYSTVDGSGRIEIVSERAVEEIATDTEIVETAASSEEKATEVTAEIEEIPAEEGEVSPILYVVIAFIIGAVAIAIIKVKRTK